MKGYKCCTRQIAVSYKPLYRTRSPLSFSSSNKFPRELSTSQTTPSINMTLLDAGEYRLKFPKPRYHWEWEKASSSKEERAFSKAAVPQCCIILHCIRSSKKTWSFLSVPFPPFLCYWWPHTLHQSIKRYQLTAQERLLPLKYQEVQKQTLSRAAFLLCFSILNSVSQLSETTETSRVCPALPEKYHFPSKTRNGWAQLDICHPNLTSVFTTADNKDKQSGKHFQAQLDFPHCF